MARLLEVLASGSRLELLHALRSPKVLHELRVRSSNPKGNQGRLLSRQTVTHHLEVLENAGLVHRSPAGSNPRSELFALNHERLFAIVDEMRSLSKLRATYGPTVEPGATIDRASRDEAYRLPPPPRLVVAYGRDEGEAFAMSGPLGSRWVLGRSAKCNVRLDYDPFCSSENSVIERREDGDFLKDLPKNRNGTWLNFARMPRGGERRMESGDIITAGRTLLVYKG